MRTQVLFTFFQGVVAAGAAAQTSGSRETPVFQVSEARIQNGQVLLSAGGKSIVLPSGTFTSEDGTRIGIERGAITTVAVPAGGRLTQFLGSPDTRPAASAPATQRTAPTTTSRPQPAAETRVIRTATTLLVRATTVAPGGVLRLRTASGEEFAAPDGRYRGEGSSDKIVMLWSGGKPVTLVVPLP
jgi:hypothetical protein